jgi:hypothetical protein
MLGPQAYEHGHDSRASSVVVLTHHWRAGYSPNVASPRRVSPLRSTSPFQRTRNSERYSPPHRFYEPSCCRQKYTSRTWYADVKDSGRLLDLLDSDDD